MDVSDSYSGKRSFADLDNADQQKSEDEEVPKKKLRTKLVDLFNRASICMTSQPEGHMKVYLRIKPFGKQEDSSQKCFVVTTEENTIEATAPVLSHTYKNMKRGLAKSSHKFTFSKIFGEDTTQAKFFNETMLSMTKDFISGQNSLVFTYGVTSSGKTYTIQGMPQDAGILPRCLDVIFNSISGKQTLTLTFKPLMFTDVSRLTPEEVLAEKKVKARTMRMSVDDDTTVMTLLGDEMESVLSESASSSTIGCAENLLKDVENRAREQLKVEVEDQGKILFCVWVSFAEIYNEQIFDLLEPLPTKKNSRRPALRICDDRNGNPYVKGLKEIHVDSADEAYRLLTIGQRNLQTACTRLNHCSSRSHCIFNIKIVRIVDDVARVSMLSLCDLAGSERYSKTQATGDRLKEAGNINASLMTLGRCIETLRHNQLHKDQQRLVPFRDSKLTRLLQNFFNGCGRASMIVNVSQCMSMFDDTLQVFKFSAIAKQVKYIDPPKPKEKKLPQMPRGSIAWETQESSEKVLLEALDNPLPDDDDNDDSEDALEGSSENKDTGVKEMQQYIKVLERRNERLVEMLDEEMNLASDLDYRVRKEVTETLMKHVDNIKETYNALLKETREETNELADERVKGIMEVYEQRIQRIQRKVDEDDEWVSSMLYYQEQCKVEEQKATIAELHRELANLKASKNVEAEDSTSLGDSVLIETLTRKLQEASESCKLKDGKIEELESLVAEAGEVYGKHVAEITELKETAKIQTDKIENQFSTIKALQIQLNDSKKATEDMKKSFKLKDTEIKALEEDLLKKIKNKDSTISSLEEECKELQDEIERLQDQMSQIDEQSKYRCDLESSTFSDKTSHIQGSIEPLKSGDKIDPVEEAKKVGQDSIGEEALKISLPEEDVKQKEMMVELLEKSNNDLESMKCLTLEMEGKILTLQLKNEQLTSEIHDSVECLKQTQGDLEEAKKLIEHYDENLNMLKKENFHLSQENISLKAANDNVQLTNEVLPKQLPQSLGKSKSPAGELNITDMVRQLEKKKTNGSGSNTDDMEKDVEGDSEVEFNFKLETMPGVSENIPTVDLSLKLKNSELANAALRSKLKREEEDFFKREQALIHGYTAEIEGLKYELAKMKSKVDIPAKARAQRNKRKLPGLDMSVCSVTSESLCDGAEGSGASRTLSLEEVTATDKQPVEVLSNEMASLQAELYSLHAAYRKLQIQNVNETNTSIQDVVLGAQTKRQSTLGVFCSEDNVTDSLLQFEVQEYAIKMDELRTKITQLETEIEVCKGELKNEKNLKKETEIQLKQLEQQVKSKDAFINEITLEKEELKDSLTKEKKLKKESTDKNLKKEAEFHLAQLEQQLASKETLVNEILLEKEELQDCLVKERDLKKETEVHVTQLELQLMNKEAHVNEITMQKAKTEYELGEMDKILNTCRQQLHNAEEKSKETEEKLQHLTVSRDELVKELSEVRMALASKEECFMQLDMQCSILLKQQKEYSIDGDSKSKAIAELQNQLIALNNQKEKMESQHQEAAAEFSQKLLMVEREKKLVERKAKEREEEWEMKCLGLEKMKQLEQKLHEQLKTNAVTMKKLSEKTLELRDQLTFKENEMDRVKEEIATLTASDKKVEGLQKRNEELLEALESEKEEKTKLQKSYHEQLCELKNGLNYSEETIVSYENLLQKQDNDIIDLKKEIDSLEMENKRLDEVIGNKELEIVHINKQLEQKDQALQQIERKALEVEHKEKFSYEQLQKTNEERGVLEESLQRLKDKNKNLKNKYEDLENLLKREKQDFNDTKDRLIEAEKSKSELEMSLKKIIAEKLSIQEELAKVVQERATAQEHSCYLEKQLNIFKEEKSKNTLIKTKHDQKYEDLESSNSQLKEEINKLKEYLKSKEKDYDALQKTCNEALESKKALEKEIQKQERLNKRNREEMENWKQEKDSCVGQLEQLINKRQQENKVLVQENELVKRENAELTKKITTVTNKNNSLIADLKKSNNTLSIQLAQVQGISPPPTMASPDNFCCKKEFVEELDTTGHLEIDATPPIAAKKCRKRLGSVKHSPTPALLSSASDPEAFPSMRMSLKTIEEQNESSPRTPHRAGSPCKNLLQSAGGKVVEIANEVLSNLTPHTRSAKNQVDKESSKKKKKHVLEPLNLSSLLTSDDSQNENAHPYSTRRSSRLKKK